MTPTIGTEKPTVQDPIIKYAEEIDWKIVPKEDALSLRKGESGKHIRRILQTFPENLGSSAAEPPLP